MRRIGDTVTHHYAGSLASIRASDDWYDRVCGQKIVSNMGVSRDNLIWRNPDPEEWIQSEVVSKEAATTKLYLVAMGYGRVGTRDTYQSVRLSASTYYCVPMQTSMFKL